MSATGRAHGLRAHHPKGNVALFAHSPFCDREAKGRPAGAGVVFGLARKERVAADHTVIGALGLGVVVLACERSFGSALLRYVVLLFAESLLELSVVKGLLVVLITSA